MIALIRSRASRYGIPVMGVLLASASQRHRAHLADEGRPPGTSHELDAGDQVLDGHLGIVPPGTPCALTGCPVPASRCRNQVPWCAGHYDIGEAIVYLERRARVTNA